MFTGLVENTGRLVRRTVSGEAGKLTLETVRPFTGLSMGESIAVNGTCLTLEEEQGERLTFHVLAETFRRTNLGELRNGALLNLERALAADGRFGGHIVSGHVDAAGRILALGRVGDDMELSVELPPEVKDFTVPKGSICVNGISLTIASLAADRFSIRIIPTTWRETNLRELSPGDRVNLEADMLGKYVRHQLETMFGKTAPSGKKELTMNDLYDAGFGE